MPEATLNRGGSPAPAPDLEKACGQLFRLIDSQGAGLFVAERRGDASPENLLFLVKFAYMTGLINKAEIQKHLGLDQAGARCLVRQWYKDHREKGCGIC